MNNKEKIQENSDSSKPGGFAKVYLVGSGPGKADLITVRGLAILQEAEVVVYDYLVEGPLLESARPDAELICCDKLAKKGRHANGFRIEQEKISELVVARARAGKKVVRLKNGDPALFARTAEELSALVEAGIEFELVPGVTAGNAAADVAGIPLTDRLAASSCVFVTGHESADKPGTGHDWSALARAGTLVFYMAVAKLPEVVQHLRRAGQSEKTPVAIIEKATMPSQRIFTSTLGEVVELAQRMAVKAPAMVVIGDVVAMAKDFNWSERNRRVLFTGLSKERFFIEGSFCHLPLIKIVGLSDYSELDSGIAEIGGFDWIVFASRYGVKFFMERLVAVGRDGRSLAGIKLAVVGNSTKNQLRLWGLQADLVPQEESAQGLLDSLRCAGIAGQRVFMPRSDISDKGLAQGLCELGARPTTAVAYRNVMPDNLPDLEFNQFDEIMFTSPSTVRNFKQRYGLLPEHIQVTCIGPTTRACWQREFQV